MSRALLWLLATLLSPSLVLADTSAERLARISGTEATAEDWQWAARSIADKTLRSEVRTALLMRDPYPRRELVDLLRHEQLAVRLGALEILEEAGGDSFGLNPWASPAGDGADPANELALTLWNRWAGGTGKVTATGNLLSAEQMQTYIRDIISGNDERKRRAIRMLEPHGLKGVTGIQDFLVNTAGLPGSSRIDLKEAQYHLVLIGTTGENAGVLARDLTIGNRDQQLAAISALKKSGLLAIPIVRDFLDSDDPLVRETAIDTILILGGSQAVSLVIPHLGKEPDANVIHASMRRFREIGGSEVRDAITIYLDREDEDLVVSAIESLTKICGGGSSPYGSTTMRVAATPGITDKILALLDDPRWRIRSAALEFVAASKTKGAADQVVKLLGDEDEFVRSQAIEAAVALNLTKAKARLTDMFLTDDDMIKPATEALTGMGIVPPPELIAHLDTRPPDIVVGAIKALNRDKKPFLEIVARYATHDDLDIACAALRSMGDDSDKLKFEFVANHLTTALQSGQDEKIQAVLDGVSLPGRSSSSFYPSFSSMMPSQPGTTLDPLYEAFIHPGGAGSESRKPVELEPGKEAEAEGGIPTLKDALAHLVTSWDDPQRAFQASFILAKAGDARGLTALTERVGQLTVSQRAAIADGLYGSQPEEAVPLLKTLMQDKVPDVRRDAADRAFNNSRNTAMIQMAFQQLGAADSRLSAHEAYGYGLESLSRERTMRRTVADWCRGILGDKDAEDGPTILALILMRQAMDSADLDLIEPFTHSGDQWTRRAAWYSLTRAKPAWVSEHIESLTSDPSPKVRAVLPMALNHKSSAWFHYFSDSRNARDRSWSSSSRKTRLSAEQIEALRTLAERDPSEEVRFESWFALLAHGQQIDLSAFLKLIPRQSKDANVAKRLASHLESNYRSMGRGMKPLLAYSDVSEIAKNKLPLVLRHFSQGGEGDSFTSFAALARATETTGDPQHVESGEDPERMAAARKRLVVVVFHKPGCKQCDKADRYLDGLKNDFPLMAIERRNITDQRDLLINQALCDRFQSSGQGKAPAIFTQAGALVAPATEPEAIAELLQNTMEMADDPTWNEFGTGEIQVAQQQVDETFANLTLSIVLGAGLLDGVNPCAFATIIFLLSYLQVARRSPREILMVGIAFIAAVFLAYFSIGIAFHGAVEWLNSLSGFHWIRTGMTWLFAAFALLVAILSLRDGLRAMRGRIKDMTLQLPDFLKTRIRGVIRRGTRSRSFVIAAFLSGLVISFLELACTGQVYAPIVFKIQQGSLDAVRYLLFYNLAFIAPLVIIFILAFGGMTSAALVRFQEKHTATVKFATAVLFFLLAAIILLGDHFIRFG